MVRRGTPITLNAASRRYNLNPSTLSRWARRGIVTVIAASTGRGHPVTLDESSVLSMAERYHRDPGKGKSTAGRSTEKTALIKEVRNPSAMVD